MRRCIGCMQSREKQALIRIAGDSAGNIFVDPTGRANGRGVYLCRDNRSCWETAKKKRAFAHSFAANLTDETILALFAQLEDLCGREADETEAKTDGKHRA